MEGNAAFASQQSLPSEVMEKVVIGGDLAGLNAAQRAEYYGAVCRSLGLNQLTKPFEYLDLNGKLRLSMPCGTVPINYAGCMASASISPTESARAISMSSRLGPKIVTGVRMKAPGRLP